jgi:hypothetical protein
MRNLVINQILSIQDGFGEDEYTLASLNQMSNEDLLGIFSELLIESEIQE